MNITITFKHLEHTEALDEKIRTKSLKLNKFLGGITELKWICYVKDGIHHADVKCLGPSFEYQASAGADTMYKTLDLVIAKLEKQVQKKKEIWKDKIHHKHSKTLAEVTEEIEAKKESHADYDDDDYERVGS